jgi:hypothetical protein
MDRTSFSVAPLEQVEGCGKQNRGPGTEDAEALAWEQHLVGGHPGCGRTIMLPAADGR